MTLDVGTRGRKSQKGFSLVELMMAMAIIAIALFGILSMITQTMSMREAARESELAKEWVQKRIEEVKSQPISGMSGWQWPSLAPCMTTQSSGTKFTATYVAVPGSTYAEPAPPLQLSGAVGTMMVDTSNPNLYEIVGTITWKGLKGTGVYTMRNLYSK